MTFFIFIAFAHFHVANFRKNYNFTQKTIPQWKGRGGFRSFKGSFCSLKIFERRVAEARFKK